MCYVWISEQTVTFALFSIYELILYNHGGEHTVWYTPSLYVKQTQFIFKGLKKSLL